MITIWVNDEQDPDKPYEPDGTQEKPYKTYDEAIEAVHRSNKMASICDVSMILGNKNVH